MYIGWTSGALSTGEKQIVAFHNTGVHQCITKLRKYNSEIKFNAKSSSSLYNNSDKVQPKSLVFNYVIKY